MELSVDVAKEDGEADGERELDTVTEALRVGLRVTVGELVRLRVGWLLALAHAVVVGLIEALDDTEELPEALAGTESVMLPVREAIGLAVRVPLDETVCEGEAEADGQREPEGEALGKFVTLRVTVGEVL